MQKNPQTAPKSLMVLLDESIPAPDALVAGLLRESSNDLAGLCMSVYGGLVPLGF